MRYLTVGELAKKTQVSTVTIRYYERCGLLPLAKRTSAGYRHYPETLIARMHFIKNAKAVGFTLEEIAELLALQVDPHAPSEPIRARTLAKLEATQDKIKTLQKIAYTLEHLIHACDGKMPMEECPILEKLYNKEENP